MTTTKIDQLECMAAVYWDMYKDAYGIRPRGKDTSGWLVEDFQAEFDRLQPIIEQQEAERQLAEIRAAARFEGRVTSLMASGASREDVIRWIADAEGAEGDPDYLCFLLGLPYCYLR